MTKSDQRTFFGKPLRDITLLYHPDKITIDEFMEEVQDGVEGYRNNLCTHDFGKESRHIEKWIESFLAWFEVEQDPDA
jgi:hypothetical protein